MRRQNSPLSFFQLLCLKCSPTIISKIERFQKTDSSEGENRMKKLLTIAFAMLLGATLSFAQAGASKPADTTTTTTTTTTKTKKGGHAHKKTAKKKKAADAPAPAPATK